MFFFLFFLADSSPKKESNHHKTPSKSVFTMKIRTSIDLTGRLPDCIFHEKSRVLSPLLAPDDDVPSECHGLTSSDEECLGKLAIHGKGFENDHFYSDFCLEDGDFP